MRISELSRESGVPIPTIKFYLREGLLPPGEATAPNQARYGEVHLRRLRLIRVLTEVGGLTLAAVRDVVAALGRPEASLHDALATAHTALQRQASPWGPELKDALVETDAWLESLGWDLGVGSPAREELAGALVALRELGWSVGPDVFTAYATAADAIAERELAFVQGTPSPEAAVEAAVVGTIVFERALAALRRIAQERHSRRRFR